MAPRRAAKGRCGHAEHSGGTRGHAFLLCLQSDIGCKEHLLSLMTGKSLEVDDNFSPNFPIGDFFFWTRSKTVFLDTMNLNFRSYSLVRKSILEKSTVILEYCLM